MVFANAERQVGKPCRGDQRDLRLKWDVVIERGSSRDCCGQMIRELFAHNYFVEYRVSYTPATPWDNAHASKSLTRGSQRRAQRSTIRRVHDPRGAVAVQRALRDEVYV
jgi:hypothetical protein